MSRSAVVIKINGDAADFNNELKKVESETKAVSVSIGKVAAASAIGFAALSTAIGAAVLEYREQVKVESATNAVLKSTGSAAGVTAEQVGALALALQKVTNYGDETIQSAENMLLTFTNIKRDVFPQVTELALDMATKLGGDASSAAQTLGKALNNPIQGMKLLTRSGVVFTEEQKKTIDAMVRTGDVAGAQAILIDRLQTKFGGSARAAADPFTQLQGVIGDVVQVMGGVFYPIAVKVAEGMKNVAFYLLEVNPQLIKIAAYGLGAAAAILGLTAAVTAGALVYLKVTAIWAAYSASAGIAATATGLLTGALTIMRTAVTLAFGPIGLLVAAIVGLGVVIYKNFDEIKAGFTGLIAGVVAFAQQFSGIMSGIGKALLGALTADPKLIMEGLSGLSESFKAGGKSAGEAFSKAYDESIAESKAARDAASAEVPVQDFNAFNEGLIEQGEYEHELEKEKKTKTLDLEKQFAEELAKIKDESAQLDVNRDAYMSAERARIDLDEKKRRLQDEAKYGKQYADVKALWRNQEVQGTQEMFSNLSTLTRSKNKELFALGKAAALANAVINTAQGVSRTLGEYAFPFNVAFAAAVAAAGAVQIATISGQTLNAAKGYSGSGSPFGESFVSTFTPREIVVPERFAEGIKKGEFSLASAKDQQAAAGGEITVHISMSEDAAEILEARQIENRKLNIGHG